MDALSTRKGSSLTPWILDRAVVSSQEALTQVVVDQVVAHTLTLAEVAAEGPRKQEAVARKQALAVHKVVRAAGPLVEVVAQVAQPAAVDPPVEAAEALAARPAALAVAQEVNPLVVLRVRQVRAPEVPLVEQPAVRGVAEHAPWP